MAPSWNTTNAVPAMFDMIARWLVPVERTLIFACILPSSLSKSARLRSSGKRAHAGEVGPHRESRDWRWRRRSVRSPLALPS